MTFETKPMRGTIRMHRLNSRTILVAVSALALASSICASRTGKTEMGQGPWADQRGGSFKNGSKPMLHFRPRPFGRDAANSW